MERAERAALYLFVVGLAAEVIVAALTLGFDLPKHVWRVIAGCAAPVAILSGWFLINEYRILWKSFRLWAVVTASLVGIILVLAVILVGNPGGTGETAAQRRTVITVDPGANVEGLKITDAQFHGMDSLVEFGGVAKDWTLNNITMDQDREKPSVATITSGYFGPPRQWVIPDKLFIVPFSDTSGSDGVRIGHVAVALRNGFAPRLMNFIVTGSGVLSVTLTLHQEEKVLARADFQDGKSVIAVKNPSGTYDVHVNMEDRSSSKYGVYFSVPELSVGN